ncbi:MAG: hypothetical protein HOM82_03450 [Thaumarchaeota archaeon]|jgi:hypothetical protein|nr:hypothetical protein [Nitrososphaerota archaeon]MBT3743094.1 hypothetical protein [Nitrososphaerota archaeon]MBT4175334.1 hypothetical protein [Nitrososphaerota archaeon]MBT4510028.1 hypothetical protein [Nitrososphaerota archaeon]MBT4675764.1 hypothetical protein [Nitrososphaerota archaeon]
MSETRISKIITNTTFLFSIGIIGISVISVIFPALIISQTYEFPLDLNPFETSPWLLPIFFSVISLLTFGFLHYKKKLPFSLSNTIDLILNFELSKRISIILGLSILAIYIGFTIPELFIDESEQWPDYIVLESALNIWPSTDHLSVYIKEQNTRYVRMILLEFSQDIFQNIKFLPFVASVFTVIFTALITIQLSKKRFAGIIAMLVLLSSVTFTDFDTIAVYENFWVLFYLISLYSINKRWWHASPVNFILSIFTKAFTATYFWMNFFYIYRATIPTKTKLLLFASYGIVLGITYWIFENGRSIIYDDIIRYDFNAFLDGFTGWGNSMQLEPFVLLFILPLTVMLFFKSRNGLKQADSIMILLAGSILAGPLISLVTDFYFILPYRFIPFVIFMAIAVGLLFSKKINPE